MRLSRLLRIAIPSALLAAALACSDSNDTTTAPGALGRVSVDAPGSATSGQAFNTDVDALNVGVQGIHNGVVQVTLASPLFINSVTPSAGSSATFTNTASGASVMWTLNTLDSNTRSTLRINATGTLSPAEAARTVRIQASMTANGINPGDAVAFDDVQLTP
jgi:hypothetical protein